MIKNNRKTNDNGMHLLYLVGIEPASMHYETENSQNIRKSKYNNHAEQIIRVLKLRNKSELPANLIPQLSQIWRNKMDNR